MPKGTEASTKDKKFYKGILLIKIRRKLISDGTYYSVEELDLFLKAYADLEGISCNDMSHEEMQILKEFCKQFARSIGLVIKESKNEEQNDDLDFARTDKKLEL